MSVKVTSLTSKDLLIEICGVEAVQTYESVKTQSMRLGNQLSALLIRKVGGRPGRHGEPFDGITQLGKWEFCLQRNTKNHAGNESDLMRAPGHCVQILEPPNPGWISSEDFLDRHGRDPMELLAVLDELRARYQLHQQIRMPV